MSNVNEGDTARVIAPGPYLGWILQVHDKCIVQSLMTGMLIWHVSPESCSRGHAPDLALKRLDKPGDDEPDMLLAPSPWEKIDA